MEVASMSIDRVVSFQVLEHVWDLDWYLSESLRVLKPDGTLWLTTHGTWPYHPHPTDFRRWTSQGLKRELESRGFEMISMKGLVGPLAWTSLFRFFGLREVVRTVPVLGSLVMPVLNSLHNSWVFLQDSVTPEKFKQRDPAIFAVHCRKKR